MKLQIKANVNLPDAVINKTKGCLSGPGLPEPTMEDVAGLISEMLETSFTLDSRIVVQHLELYNNYYNGLITEAEWRAQAAWIH